MLTTTGGWRRVLPLPALALSAAFLFWPALHQPLMLDDVDVVPRFPPFVPSRVASALALLDRCTLPHYFRPMMAPILFVWHLAFGLEPFPLRLAMLLLQIATAGVLFLIAEALFEDPVAGAIAAALYGLSWIHWDMYWQILNLGASLSDFLLWSALLVYLRRDSAFPASLALASAALLCKDSAVAFAPLATGAGLLSRGNSPRLRRHARILAAWAALYIAARALLPGSPFTNENFWSFSPANALDWRPYRDAVWMMLAPLLAPPSAAEIAYALGSTAWTAAALSLAAFSGAGLSLSLRAGPAPRTAVGAPRALLFAAAGALIGLLPFAFFRGALNLGGAHRFMLGWAALSLGLGAALARLLRALHRIHPAATAAAAFLLPGWIFLGAAARLRYQDPRTPVFSSAPILHDTVESLRRVRSSTAGRLCAGDEMAFVDFPDFLRVPLLLQALERTSIKQAPAPGPRTRWVLRWRRHAKTTEVSVSRPPERASVSSWDDLEPGRPLLRWRSAPRF